MNFVNGPRRKLLVWPLIVPGLLLAHVIFCCVTVYFAVSDPTFATEPNYYRKALNWDATAAQRSASAQLGWNVELAVASQETAEHQRDIRLRLVDRDGSPIAGVQAVAEVFPHARANERATLRFSAQDATNFIAPLRVERPGVWEVRITATAADRTFATTQLIDIAPAVGVRS